MYKKHISYIYIYAHILCVCIYLFKDVCIYYMCVINTSPSNATYTPGVRVSREKPAIDLAVAQSPVEWSN